MSLMVVVLNEYLDLALNVSGQEAVFEQDAILQDLVPAANL